MSMYYPQLDDTEKDSSFIRAFNGLNHTEVIDESMFYDMENCTTDKFPLLTRRKPRATRRSGDTELSCIGNGLDGIAWTTKGGENAGFTLYYKGIGRDGGASPFVGTPKQIVPFGAYVIAFPQGAALDTSTTPATMNPIPLHAEDVKIYGHWNNVRQSGESIPDSRVKAGTSEPTNPSESTYWRDTNFDPPKIKQWSRSQQMWADVDFYVDIGFYKEYMAGNVRDPGAYHMEFFHKGDTVKIDGLVDYEQTVGEETRISPWSKLNGTHVIQEVVDNRLSTIDGVTCRYVILRLICPYFFWDKGPDNIHITLERAMPDMDFVCANAGHLFGCSNENHEIYVSANADPFNWNTFEGTANDSYAEVVGTPGDFTGCIAYRDSVLFFKEDRIHILYGKRPSAYQLDQLECVGLQKGCYKTLAIANETLFYKGKYGFYAYSGGLPELISEALGDYNNLEFTSAGSDGQKYYACGGGKIFSFDPRRGIWAIEDEKDAIGFANCGLRTYMMCKAGSDGKARDFVGMEHYPECEEDVYGRAADPTQYPFTDESGDYEWSATTGWIGLDSPDEKYISRLRLRLEIPLGSVFIVETAYDNNDTFTEVERVNGDGLRPVFINILPRRCDVMRLRFRGIGDFKLYSIAKQYEQGSDSY